MSGPDPAGSADRAAAQETPQPGWPRVAVVTGGASGIGQATAGLLAAQGVRVAVLDRAGDYGRPEEVAHMIVALTAPEASFVNGAVITVDGGMSAQGR
ncbi:short chain dehydrogenase [Parafrankia irregularis]|uniref:Short chain dehydrogenase n=1 Tax=Parafrankia irregularis TaxID=795642 RepID=A0A0S4QMK5_9ACTN|nr:MULTISPECIES: SDR family oxidoreductase [Parafrankia]CUU56707.1 short chain dehydrogenase [Parafrankia irregularis]